jgi:hypothetical protein
MTLFLFPKSIFFIFEVHHYSEPFFPYFAFSHLVEYFVLKSNYYFINILLLFYDKPFRIQRYFL